MREELKKIEDALRRMRDIVESEQGKGVFGGSFIGCVALANDALDRLIAEQEASGKDRLSESIEASAKEVERWKPWMRNAMRVQQEASQKAAVNTIYARATEVLERIEVQANATGNAAAPAFSEIRNALYLLHQQACADDLTQLIHAALTNPADLRGFIEANYPVHFQAHRDATFRESAAVKQAMSDVTPPDCQLKSFSVFTGDKPGLTEEEVAAEIRRVTPEADANHKARQQAAVDENAPRLDFENFVLRGCDRSEGFLDRDAGGEYELNAKRTPGKWEAEELKLGSLWLKTRLNVYQFNEGLYACNDIARERHRANCAFAAAAPEMMALIESLSAELERKDKLLVMAREAVVAAVRPVGDMIVNRLDWEEVAKANAVAHKLLGEAIAALTDAATPAEEVAE